MARLIQLHLDESAAPYTDTGTTAGVWNNSSTPPTAGATGILGGGDHSVDMIGDSNRRYIVGQETTPNYDLVEPVNHTLIAWVYLRSDPSGTPGHVVHKVYRTGSDWNSPWVALGMEIEAGTSIPDFNVTVSGTLNKYFSPFSLSLNTWHMLAQTYDGTTLKGYVDGAKVVHQYIGGAVDYGTHGKWMAGSANDGSGSIEPINALIDEISLDDTVFTDAQIYAIYRSSIRVTPEDGAASTARFIELHLDETSAGEFISLGIPTGYFISVGSPTPGASGIIGNGVDFINDNVGTRYLYGDPNVFDYIEPQAFSLRAWVYMHAASSGLHDHIVHKSSLSGFTWASPFTAVQIHILPSTTTPHFDVNNTFTPLSLDGPSMSLNTWYHLCMTYTGTGSGAVLTAYVNGVQVGQVGGGTFINYNQHGHWVIGGSYGTNETFPGIIDEVYLDGYVMTPAQVLAEYQAATNAGPQVLSAAFIDQTHVEVIFNEDVDHTDAINPSNFAFSGGVTAGAAFYTPSNFRTLLTVTGAKVDTAYTLTVSNVRDVADVNTIAAPYNKALVDLFGAQGQLAPPATSTVLIQAPIQNLDTNTIAFGPQVPFQIGITKFFIILAGAVDGTHVKIVFNRTPVASEALNPVNYAINHGLNVVGVTQETDVTFTLQTTPQDPGTQYTLTATNIHDLDGDPI